MLIFFFFNDTATTEIYTLSLHDALPICLRKNGYTVTIVQNPTTSLSDDVAATRRAIASDRKSTRLNSSHSQISYAVFCLKKKKNHPPPLPVAETDVDDYSDHQDSHVLEG